MRIRLACGLWCFWVSLAIAAEPVSGEAMIRKKLATSEIVIKTTSRLAGAIDSLTWNGQEFVDSVDHGRQLQSACSFDAGIRGPFWAECYNPTEAGSRLDGAGKRSSSKLLSIKAENDVLTTKTQMAFWLTPTEKSSGRPALNKSILSDHVVSKTVKIGYKQWDHVVNYRAVFTVPKGEQHHFAQFEALTGYMPATFSRFWRFNPTTRKLEELSDGPGEQPWPVVLATANGSHAMGIYSPDSPTPGYGRFRFVPEKVVKWNCVFRYKNAENIPAGDYPFQMYVPIGDLTTVEKTLQELVPQTKK